VQHVVDINPSPAEMLQVYKVAQRSWLRLRAAGTEKAAAERLGRALHG